MADLLMLGVLLPLAVGYKNFVSQSLSSPAPKIRNPEKETCEAKTQWLRLRDGRILEFSTFGAQDGAAIFFFTGNHQTCNILGAAAPLREQFTNHNLRLVCPSYPGFGLSDALLPGNTPPAVQWWPADIEQLAEKLGIDKFYIISHSLGSMYATATIHAIPERVLGCVLASPIIPMPVQLTLDRRRPRSTRMLYNLLMKPHARELVSMSLADNPMAMLKRASPDSAKALEKMGEKGGQSGEIRDAIVADCNRAVANTWRGLACAMELVSQSWGFELNELSDFAQSGKPLIIAASPDDVTNPTEFHHWLNREISGSRLVTINEGEGHLFLFEPRNLDFVISCLLEEGGNHHQIQTWLEEEEEENIL